MEHDRRTLRLSPRSKPVRLDRALAEELDAVSRTLTQRWIHEGRVLLNGRPAKAAALVQGGEEIVLDLPPPQPIDLPAENIPLTILFEDDALVIVDKPAGISTHPAGPIRQGTLVNALLHHVRTLSHLGGDLRPGIVHRLDKGTSGLLVVAKTDDAHRRLAKDLAQRKISRIYEALVWGTMRPSSFTIDAPVGRHPQDRKRMAVVERGKPARSHVRILESRELASRVEVSLETGRTHQIRVHLAHRGHPVVGDATYGGRKRRIHAGTEMRERAARLLGVLSRPALHARELRLVHPLTGEPMVFTSPLPEDFVRALAILRENSASS